MRKTSRLIAVVLVAGLTSNFQLTNAWGGLFNRFSPEVLSNMGYGNHGDDLRSSTFLQRTGGYGNSFGEGLGEVGDESCYDKRCTSNEHCCPGTVCVNVDGVVGSCLFTYGLKQGELCRRDDDCETGLVCSQLAGSDNHFCQPPLASNRQYSEDCTMSSECDISRGLCCQLQRRHRQTPRKMCSYFKDPLVCIGPVATDQVKHVVQYTAGEKRITERQRNPLKYHNLYA